ncbi:MAG TPA: hypothetical protein VIG54_05810 [Lysobacter sp.]
MPAVRAALASSVVDVANPSSPDCRSVATASAGRLTEVGWIRAATSRRDRGSGAASVALAMVSGAEATARPAATASASAAIVAASVACIASDGRCLVTALPLPVAMTGCSDGRDICKVIHPPNVATPIAAAIAQRMRCDKGPRRHDAAVAAGSEAATRGQASADGASSGSAANACVQVGISGVYGCSASATIGLLG